jgi:hypothetical protein
MTFPPLRVWLLVVLVSLVLLIIFYLLVGRTGLFIGLGFSLLWSYTMLLHRHTSAIDHFSGRPVMGRDAWGLLETIEIASQKIRCAQPQLYLSQNQNPIFIATSSEWNQPALLISKGLINHLTESELHSLMYLGVATIKHRTSFVRYTLERMGLSWIALGKLIDSMLPFRDLNWAYRFSYFLAWLHLRIAFPHNLQSKADLEAFQSIPHSRDLANALWKIHGTIDTHPLEIPHSFQHQSLLGPANSRRGAFHFILPIELRLRFLVGYFPI